MKQKWKNHVMMHAGRKPHECDECGVGFVHKQSWTAHIRSVIVAALDLSNQYEKGLEHFFQPHSTSVMAFAKLYTWFKFRRCHDGTTIDCSKCGKQFVDESYLKRHLRWHEKVRNVRSDQ